MMADVQGNAVDRGRGRAALLHGTSLQKLDKTLENLAQVTQDIRDGRGRWESWSRTSKRATRWAEAIQGVSDYANRLVDLKIEVTPSSVYLFNAGAAQIDATIRIIPRPDKYYLSGLVDDPRGRHAGTSYVTQPPRPVRAGGPEAHDHQLSTRSSSTPSSPSATTSPPSASGSSRARAGWGWTSTSSTTSWRSRPTSSTSETRRSATRGCESPPTSPSSSISS